jgi:hypothetical protein
MLALLMISWVGITTFLWILGAGLVVAGIVAAVSRRVI